MSDVARLEALLAELTARRESGGPLTEFEQKALATLDEANAAEAAARQSFAAFYALQTHAVSGEEIALPVEVALVMTRWAEAGKAWEAIRGEMLVRLPAPRRPRVPVKPATRVLVPTVPAARDALAALFAPGLWQTDRTGSALLANLAGTQLRVELDGAPGYTPDGAVQQIARHGPSAVQTFLALVSLWHERCGGAPAETYLNVTASELLRFQGRRQTPRGGYHKDDLLAKGRDVYFLSRITVPVSGNVTQGEHTVQRAAMGRLLSLESLDAEMSDRGPSVVQFRYHLGAVTHAWLGAGEETGVLPGKLLAYHPVRQKYQILFGLCLAWWERTRRDGVTRLRLTELLDLASVPRPTRRLAEALESIDEALRELARDGVFPGLTLERPARWHEMLAERRTRSVLEETWIVVPPRPSEATALLEGDVVK